MTNPPLLFITSLDMLREPAGRRQSVYSLCINTSIGGEAAPQRTHPHDRIYGR